MIGQSSEKATRQKDYGSMGDYQKKKIIKRIKLIEFLSD